MPWTISDPPSPAKNWDADSKRKCVEAANAVLEEDGSEEDAIFACIRAAGKSEQANNMQFLTNAVQTAKTRRIEHGGREWLVVPVVMVAESEQVMNGELVTVDEIVKFPEAWNGRPVTLGHPKRAGQPISAGSPEVDSKECIGRIFNTSCNGKAKAEMWIDLQKAESLGGDAALAVQKFKAGELVEVSTGYFRDLEERSGRLNGQRYDGIARNIRPDHLAILLHEEGACSIKDGCGAPRANREEDAETRPVIRNEREFINLVKRSIREGVQALERGIPMNDEERQELIDALVANADWEAEQLENLEDPVLQKIAAMAEREAEKDDEEPTAAKPEPATDEAPAWAEALVKRLETIEGQLAANEAEERSALVKAILDNPLNPFDEADLEEMAVNKLKALKGKLVVPNYAGRAGSGIDPKKQGIQPVRRMPAIWTNDGGDD